MRTIKTLLIISSIFLLLGCNLPQITTTDITSTNTTQSSTESTTLDETTIQLQEELLYLTNLIPNAISKDFALPTTQNPSISVTYYLNSNPNPISILTYTPNHEDIEINLIITLTKDNSTISKDQSIFILRDPVLYTQYQNEQTTIEILNNIIGVLPTQITSDFTLPNVEHEETTINYSVNHSRIFRNRFIFTFPITDQSVKLTISVTYKTITKIEDFTFIMKGLASLPNIPSIHIQTENNTPITSKEYYINATFSLKGYDSHNNPINLTTNQSIQIRGRGNSTFFMPKQSFRLKFDNKTPLLFDYSESDWVLLANFTDQSLIRNYLAYNLSESMGRPFSPSAAFVDVYLNNEYLGNYLLTDQIEVTGDRVNIEEHSSELDTGYLIEFDKRILDFPEGIENVDYFILYGVPYVIKSPKTDSIYYSQSQLYFIEDYLVTTLNILMNKQDYSSYIDEASFVDWFIINELFKNVDSGYSSVYMQKDKGSKLAMGPIWDFDLSAWNPGHLPADLRGPTGWYTSLEYKNPWFYYLMKYDSFQSALKQRWNEVYEIQIKAMIESIYPISDSISKSRYLNFVKWNIIGSNSDWYTSPEVYNATTYEEQVALLFDFLMQRSEWLNREINKLI